jgi:hypothetical protein
MALKQKMMDYINFDKRKSIYIPEWEETIYFTPITVTQMEKIMTLAQGGTAATHVWTLIEKAENQDGTKAFGAEDKPFLEQLDWNIVTRITGELLKIPSVEEEKKTSGRTSSN